MSVFSRHSSFSSLPKQNTPESSTDYDMRDESGHIEVLSQVAVDIADTAQIDNETNLIQYTERHFNNHSLASRVGMNDQRQPIMASYDEYEFYNNSPISMSNSNSDSDDQSKPYSYIEEDEFVVGPIEHAGRGPGTSVDHGAGSHADSYYSINHDMVGPGRNKQRKFTYRDIERNLDKYYYGGSGSGSAGGGASASAGASASGLDTANQASNEVDILTTYLRGQKHLYTLAKTVTEQKLNGLTIFSLALSASAAIFAPFIQEFSWSGGFISALNAVVTLLITLINYLKLESTVESFLHLANQYDKLESSLEMVSGKLTFMNNDSDKNKLVLSKMRDVEKKIQELKEWNQVFLPSDIKRRFPIICYINIFSFIQRMDSYKKTLIIKLKDIKNEIRYIMNRRSRGVAGSDLAHINQRLAFLMNVKEKVKEELMHYRSAYGTIDEIFTREIKRANSCRSGWFFCVEDHGPVETKNPVIDRYMQFIFME